MTIYLTWAVMWLADLIPWVSWWTIAFISGIYEKLIGSISAINIELLWMVLKWQIVDAWKKINWSFLIALFAWIWTSIVLWASLIAYLLDTQLPLVQSFFVWLIISCCVLFLFKYMRNEWRSSGIFVLWVIVGFLLTASTWLHLPVTPLWFLLAWFFGSMAMLLPWISWSYIMLILWMYEPVIQQIDKLSTLVKSWLFENVWVVLIPLMSVWIWVILWILTMSKLLKRLLSRFHDSIIVVLIGCMLWALPAVLPESAWIASQPLLSCLFFALWIITIIGFFKITESK